MNPARIFPLTLATVLGVGSLCNHASAAATIRVTESGGDVVISATGSLNTAGLTFSASSSSGQGVHPAASFLEVSSGTVDLYNSVSGPSSFGSGGFKFPSSGSGDRFGIRYGAGSLVVPAGYVSGNPLSGTSTYTNSSFAQLGLAPGTYTWTWGSGGNADSLTLKVVDTAIPIQASLVIDANQNPVLRWQAEVERRYSISYSADLKTYVPIANGFPVGGAAAASLLEFRDLPTFTRTTPKGFYKVEREPLINPTSTDRLTEFFDSNGGRAGFPAVQVKAVETVILALEEIEAGQLGAARTRVDAMLAAYPLSSGAWYNGLGYRGLNLGTPIGYYDIRMLDQILTLGNPSRAGKLKMTVVVAPTATVTRPTLPTLALETLERSIAPEILADDGRRLKLVTRLFRRWIQAITGGLHVDLAVHVMDQGITVNFSEDPRFFFSTPQADPIIDSLPTSIVDNTDIWWLVYPSGVPGDASGYSKSFITGGMGKYSNGAPIIISDDSSCIRKTVNLGTGPYSDIELEMYQPQWLHHEFMHHMYSTWTQFELETTSHQWFVPSNWPSDFVGYTESDYYAESLTKRLLGATPSIARGLQIPDPVDMSVLPLAKLVGSYRREPVLNLWHEVTISLVGNNLRWTNAEGRSWGLEIVGKELWTTTEGPYGVLRLRPQIDDDGNVIAIGVPGEVYQRVGTASAALRVVQKIPSKPIACPHCSYGHGPLSLPTSKVAPTSPVQNLPDPAVLK